MSTGGKSTKEKIAAERIRISKSVQGNKLGKLIGSQILDPMLKAIDKEIEVLNNVIGKFVVEKIRQNILSSTPSGRTYQVVLVTGNGDKNKYEVIGSYTASAPGQPPNSTPGPAGVPSGTLFESIEFIIEKDGRIRVGVLNSNGNEVETLFYHDDKIFIGQGKGRKKKKTSVVEYANALEHGASSDKWDVAARPWLHDLMRTLEPEIRKIVKDRIKQVMSRHTRSKGKKAIYTRVFFREKTKYTSSDESEE